MPPPVTFGREQIVQTALAIAEEGGMNTVTARTVAGRLNSSTQPVYSCFSSVAELRRQIMIRAVGLLGQYIVRPHTTRTFLNVGAGIAIFARDHRELYRALFLEKHSDGDIIREFQTSMNDIQDQDARFTGNSAAVRRRMISKIWIFSHGMATLICADLMTDESADNILESLNDFGSAVVAAEISRAVEGG